MDLLLILTVCGHLGVLIVAEHPPGHEDASVRLRLRGQRVRQSHRSDSPDSVPVVRRHALGEWDDWGSDWESEWDGWSTFNDWSGWDDFNERHNKKSFDTMWNLSFYLPLVLFVLIIAIATGIAFWKRLCCFSGRSARPVVARGVVTHGVATGIPPPENVPLQSNMGANQPYPSYQPQGGVPQQTVYHPSSTVQPPGQPPPPQPPPGCYPTNQFSPHPPNQGSYPPPQGSAYPPNQGPYPPPQGQSYPPNQGPYPPPQGQSYPPNQGSYPPPQGQGYPPNQGPYPPPAGPTQAYAPADTPLPGAAPPPPSYDSVVTPQQGATDEKQNPSAPPAGM